jgi:hypothetical protein
MIPLVSRRSTQNSLNSQKNRSILRILRVLRCTFVIASCTAALSAHDLERTQVRISFSRDGSFVLDVANDPVWLKLRTDTVPGPFADRVVLWVDGREIRPASVEFVAGDALATHRLRGRVPVEARTLRWYYGLVIDPYPLTVRRADGRVVIEEVQGDAWSGTIDLTGQFQAPLVSSRLVGILAAALLLVPVALRIQGARLFERVFTTKDTKDTKGRQNLF